MTPCVHWRDPDGTWSNLNADLVENGLAAWAVDGEEPGTAPEGVPGRDVDERTE